MRKPEKTEIEEMKNLTDRQIVDMMIHWSRQVVGAESIKRRFKEELHRRMRESDLEEIEGSDYIAFRQFGTANAYTKKNLIECFGETSMKDFDKMAKQQGWYRATDYVKTKKKKAEKSDREPNPSFEGRDMRREVADFF
jgi:hypothetical protein